MTVHVVVAETPTAEAVSPGLVASTPLEPTEAAALVEAMLQDVCRTIETSGGDLVVGVSGVDEGERGSIASTIEPGLDDPGAVRYEAVAGRTAAEMSARALTALLRDEGVTSAAVVSARAPTLARTDLDGAAMKLRRSDAVVGPAPGDRIAYLGLREPVEFAEGGVPEALTSVVAECAGAGHDVDFLGLHPVVTRGPDLVSLVALVAARRTAGRWVPPATARTIDDLGVGLVDRPDGPALTVD